MPSFDKRNVARVKRRPKNWNISVLDVLSSYISIELSWHQISNNPFLYLNKLIHNISAALIILKPNSANINLFSFIPTENIPLKIITNTLQKRIPSKYTYLKSLLDPEPR